jgi:hypothetical protein
MKIARQLRLDALAADSTAPIHLTTTWEGSRIRLGTVAVVHPAPRYPAWPPLQPHPRVTHEAFDDLQQQLVHGMQVVVL